MAPGYESWNDQFDHPIPEYNPESAINVFKKQVESALDFKPLKINSHSRMYTIYCILYTILYKRIKQQN